MKISIISGSNRKNSQSERVSSIIKDECEKNEQISANILSLYKENIPLWSESGLGDFEKRWQVLSDMLSDSDGFVFVVPEWHGMVPPHVKNLLLTAGTKVLWHKPGLIVTLSSATGGAYPAMELRGSTQKNSHICWIPEQIVIRNVKNWYPTPNNEIYKRLLVALRVLLVYADLMRVVRQRIADDEHFDFGM